MSSQDQSDGDGVEALESVSVHREPVTVRKAAESRGDGIVINYTLESTSASPLDVELVDELPSSDYSEVGFHPDHAPVSWTEEGGSVSIKHTLDADETGLLKLGFVNEEPVTADPESLSRPEVKIGEFDHSDAEAASAVETDDDGDEGKLLGRARKMLFSRRTEDADAETGDESAADAEPAEAADTEPAEAADTEPAEASDAESAETADTEPTEATVAEPEPTPSDANQADEAVTSVDSKAPEPGESMVSELVSEIRNGNVSEDEIASLRNALGVERTSSEEIRLEHVQSRMYEFDAYVDALQTFLDQFGTPAEYATSAETERQKLWASVDAIEETLSELRDEQSSLRSRIVSIESTLEELEGNVDAVSNEIGTIRTEYDAKFSEQAEKQEVTKSELEHLEETLESELEDLRADLETFDSIRATFVEAFDVDAEES